MALRRVFDRVFPTGHLSGRQAAALLAVDIAWCAALFVYVLNDGGSDPPGWTYPAYGVPLFATIWLQMFVPWYAERPARLASRHGQDSTAMGDRG